MKNLLILIKSLLSNKMLIGLIGVLFLILCASTIYIQHNKVNKLESQIQNEVKLRNSLLSTITTYKNANNELTNEKLTIQTSLNNLKKINSQLTDSQKELLNRIKEVEKDKSVITAALIHTQVKLDSLMHNGQTTIDSVKKTINFTAYHKEGSDKIGYKEVGYSFTVGKVLPQFSNVKPTLMIDSLYFPNKQYIEFYWKNNRKEGNPIAFSVSNSNGYFKVANIDSYAIPEITKKELKPNFWNKLSKFFKNTSNKIVYFGLGGVAGAGAYWFLTK